MQFIINFLFRRLSVDSIIASFDKTIAKLETVQARQTAKVERETDRIKRAAEKRTKHADEATRATETAERFKRLVRGDYEPKISANGDAKFGGSIIMGENGTIKGFGVDSPGFSINDSELTLSKPTIVNPQFGVGADSLQVSPA